MVDYNNMLGKNTEDLKQTYRGPESEHTLRTHTKKLKSMATLQAVAIDVARKVDFVETL